MTPATRTQLRALDAALLALVSERARLLARDPGRASVEDLLRRHDASLAVQDVRELFALLDRACAPGVRP